jgi:hypothetical protein
MALFLKAGAQVRERTSEAPLSLERSGTPGKSRRNVAIDVLRGYCIVMMITSHVATTSYVNNGVHLLRFVSGAEGFVFLAGLVLGMVYRRKLDAAPAVDSYKAIWKRAGLIWAVHCTVVLAALTLNNALFHYPDIPDTRSLGVLKTLWLTATLQLQPGHLLNILPLYVFLLAAAPIAFELLRRGKTPWLLAASIGAFIYMQYEPGAGRWAHSISGGEAFPPLAWQGLFLPAMAIGYHQALIRSTFLNRWRTVLLWTLGIACAAMIVLVGVQTPTFQFYSHEAWDLFLWERHPLRLGRVLYFLLSVSAFYLLAQAWLHRWKLPKLPLEILATLGRNSLYAFLVHLVFAFCLGALQIPPDRWLVLEALPLGTVIAVYFMARYKVARRWIPN